MLAATQPLASLIVEELAPGPSVRSDADVDNYIYQVAEYVFP
jgi:hypothetical protein